MPEEIKARKESGQEPVWIERILTLYQRVKESRRAE